MLQGFRNDQSEPGERFFLCILWQLCPGTPAWTCCCATGNHMSRTWCLVLFSLLFELCGDSPDNHRLWCRFWPVKPCLAPAYLTSWDCNRSLRWSGINGDGNETISCDRLLIYFPISYSRTVVDFCGVHMMRCLRRVEAMVLRTKDFSFSSFSCWVLWSNAVC